MATQSRQAEPEPIEVGQRVWAWIGAFKKWGQGVVSDILQDVSWTIRFEGECLDTLKIYHAHEIESIVGSV
jgi:hypothetical protein